MNKIIRFFDICGEYVMKYRRYFCAALVGAGMVGMLAVGTTNHVNPMAGAYGSYEDESTNKKLTKLLTTYYEAYDANDTESLQKVATPFSERELSYIALMSEYIDAHKIEEIYTKQGADAESLLVSVKVYISYTSLETPAPALDFFYVQTDKDGNYYINNAYSLYNLQNGDTEVDETITSLLAVFEAQEDVVELINDVNAEHEELMLSDAEYNAFFSTTLRDAIANWASNYEQQLAEQKAAEEAAAAEAEAAAQAEAEAKAAEEAAAAEAEAAAAAEAEEEANAVTVRVTAKVNVRESASTDAASLGKVSAGTELKKYAEEGEWSKIDYNGTKAYIKTEYLEAVEATDADDADDTTEDTAAEEDATAGFAAGDSVTLSATVNVRSEMDESSSKVAVAYAGTSVEIVMPYANGWTKVSYGGKEGYMKTDLIK